MNNFFHSNINEIKESRVLKILGFLYCIIISLTGAHWLYDKNSIYILSKNVDGICWPFMESCQQFHLFNGHQWKYLIISLVLFGFLNSLFFLKSRTIKWAYILLLILSILKFSIILIDYRMRLNQHIMIFWLTMSFLFFPKKKQVIYYLLILFYFFSGLLKLNQEWLSGAALYAQPLFIPEKYTSLACYFVVVLELFLIWGLLLKKKEIRYSILSLLTLFHISSFPVVGFFYPVLMLLLISFFPLCWYFDSKREYLFIFSKNKVSFQAISFLGIFICIQFYPYITRSDHVLTGDGKLLALHMFDALPECEANVEYRRENGTFYNEKIVIGNLPPRIRCQPYIYSQWAEKRCLKRNGFPRFKDLSISLKARRKTQDQYTETLKRENICQK